MVCFISYTYMVLKKPGISPRPEKVVMSQPLRYRKSSSSHPAGGKVSTVETIISLQYLLRRL